MIIQLDCTKYANKRETKITNNYADSHLNTDDTRTALAKPHYEYWTKLQKAIYEYLSKVQTPSGFRNGIGWTISSTLRKQVDLSPCSKFLREWAIKQTYQNKLMSHEASHEIMRHTRNIFPIKKRTWQRARCSPNDLKHHNEMRLSRCRWILPQAIE